MVRSPFGVERTKCNRLQCRATQYGRWPPAPTAISWLHATMGWGAFCHAIRPVRPPMTSLHRSLSMSRRWRLPGERSVNPLVVLFLRVPTHACSSTLRMSSLIVIHFVAFLSRAGEAEGKIGDLDTSNLVGVDRLASPGEADGQIIMVRDGSKVMAHSWSSAENAWQTIGEVSNFVLRFPLFCLFTSQPTIARMRHTLFFYHLYFTRISFSVLPLCESWALFSNRCPMLWTRKQVLLRLDGSILMSNLTARRWCAVTRRETIRSSPLNDFLTRTFLTSRCLIRYVINRCFPCICDCCMPCDIMVVLYSMVTNLYHSASDIKSCCPSAIGTAILTSSSNYLDTPNVKVVEFVERNAAAPTLEFAAAPTAPTVPGAYV